MENFENMILSEGEFNTYLAAISIANLYSQKYELEISRSFEDEEPCFNTLDEINYNFIRYYDTKKEILYLSKFPVESEMTLYGLSKICLRSASAILELINLLKRKLLEEDIALCIKRKNTSRKHRLTEKQLILMEWLLEDIYELNSHFNNFSVVKNQDDTKIEHIFLFSKKTSKKEMKEAYSSFKMIYEHKNCFRNQKNEYLTDNLYFNEAN